MEVRSRKAENLPYYLSGLVLTRRLLKLYRSAQDLTQIRNFGCKIQMTDRLLITTTTTSALSVASQGAALQVLPVPC